MRALFVGAHPDDAEFHAGGLMIRHAEAGNDVGILCLTDGSAGHQKMDRAALAERRADEAARAAALIGATVTIWPVPDGALEPTVTHRNRLIGFVRDYRPDLIVTHRVWDYHPDHRACGTLVKDAAYLLRVPNVVPDTPALDRDPVIACAYDRFTEPAAFRPDVVVDIGAQLERIVAMLDCHASQVYEWLPHMLNIDPPRADRIAWLASFFRARPAGVARRFSDHLDPAAGEAERVAEAFQISEYGRQPTPGEIDTLFAR